MLRHPRHPGDSIGRGSFGYTQGAERPIESNRKYNGVNVISPQAPAIQNTSFANFSWDLRNYPDLQSATKPSSMTCTICTYRFSTYRNRSAVLACGPKRRSSTVEACCRPTKKLR